MVCPEPIRISEHRPYDQSAWTVIKKWTGVFSSTEFICFILLFCDKLCGSVELSCSQKAWAQFMDWSIGTWLASLSLLTQAGGGNTASYFGESKIPFSKSLLKSSPTYGVPCFGGKNAQVFKCLLLVIITAFLTETLSWRAINWGVCDVGRTGTWCHCSGPLGPFGSALELGVAFPLCLFQKAHLPRWWLNFKSFHVSDVHPSFLVVVVVGDEGSQKWRGEMRRNEFVISPSFLPKPACQ